jgi:Amino-terminal Zinc-binding domain of ubiquitin ligase E3A
MGQLTQGCGRQGCHATPVLARRIRSFYNARPSIARAVALKI